jgi:dynein heavy chain
VQPRLSSSSGEKTSDEIVFELAGNILNKIPDKLDIDKALPELFEVCLPSTGSPYGQVGGSRL